MILDAAANRNQVADDYIDQSLGRSKTKTSALVGGRRKYVRMFDRGNLQIDNSRLPLRREQACKMQEPSDMRLALVRREPTRWDFNIDDVFARNVDFSYIASDRDYTEIEFDRISSRGYFDELSEESRNHLRHEFKSA